MIAIIRRSTSRCSSVVRSSGKTWPIPDLNVWTILSTTSVRTTMEPHIEPETDEADGHQRERRWSGHSGNEWQIRRRRCRWDDWSNRNASMSMFPSDHVANGWVKMGKAMRGDVVAILHVLPKFVVRKLEVIFLLIFTTLIDFVKENVVRQRERRRLRRLQLRDVSHQIIFPCGGGRSP